MSLLKLSNYEGKPYSSGFTLSNTTEFSGLNKLSLTDTKVPFFGKATRILVPIKIVGEKGPDCHVVQSIEDEDLPSVAIMDPNAYENEKAQDLMPMINQASINYIYAGRAEIELESGEIIPVDESDYSIHIKEGDVLGQQKFEVLSEDIHHTEGDTIDLYPLGALLDPGKSIASIQPTYFQVTQDAEGTKLKLLTTEKITSAGGFYSTDGFEYGEYHYNFITDGDKNKHKSIEDYIKEGNMTLRIVQGTQEGAGAASGAGGDERIIEVESSSVYGNRPDELILGFKFSDEAL